MVQKPLSSLVSTAFIVSLALLAVIFSCASRSRIRSANPFPSFDASNQSTWAVEVASLLPLRCCFARLFCESNGGPCEDDQYKANVSAKCHCRDVMDPTGVCLPSSNRAVDSFHKTSIVIRESSVDEIIFDEEGDVVFEIDDGLLNESCLALPPDSEEYVR